MGFSGISGTSRSSGGGRGTSSFSKFSDASGSEETRLLDRVREVSIELDKQKKITKELNDKVSSLEDDIRENERILNMLINNGE